MAEQTFWQRCSAYFAPAAGPVDVALPLEKLRCSMKARRSEKYKPVVLVSCGSFNPPTIMHLRLFELAKDRMIEEGYDVLGGYMSPVNDKYNKAGLAGSGHRVAMSQAAAEASDIVMVDKWESEQPEYQRSLLVLRSIKERLQKAMSMDAVPPKTEPSVQEPGVWKPDQLRAILEDHGVVCITRNTPSLQEALSHHQDLQKYEDKIVWVEEPVVNEISSSKLRELIRRGKSAKFLTPDPVLKYIKEHKLYHT